MPERCLHGSWSGSLLLKSCIVMPFSKRHHNQKAKNYTLLVILIVVVMLLFSLSFVKLGNIL